MRALDAKLWRELRQLRGQAIAIALVLTGGIASVLMALSNYQALSDTRARYYAEYRFADVFAQAKRAPRALLPALAAIPGVARVEARVMGFATLELPGFDDAVTGQLLSLPAADDPGLNAVYLRAGRLPERDDEVLLGEAFAEAQQLRPGDRFTALLNGRRQTLRVVGTALSPEFVYAMRPGDFFPDFERFAIVWMPREPLARAFDLDGAFNSLALALRGDSREGDVIAAVDALLAPYGGSGAQGRELQLSHRFLSQELDQLRIMARLFGLIFLVVSAFLVNVVIGRLIASQREQIALLKAFGYTRLEVTQHYGKLALLLAALGLVPGVLLGAWAGRAMAGLYQDFFRFPFLDWRLTPEMLLLALGFALVAALLGTVAALRRVYRLAPAEAMRPEAPPQFRRTLAERLGLGRFLAPAARMVLRNLERRPLRTALSVFGIGLACGIVVMSRFQFGAIEHLVDVQFQQIQRDDLAVALTEPASRRVVDELASLPGVLAVEPWRHAAVRLRHGHRDYRTALQGLPAQGELRRLLDDRLQPVALPDDGMLLTDHLAEMLAVRTGDTLDVEFLEGHRRTLPVRVVGTVREYLGVGAYARRETVNRLLQEDDAVGGAWLRIDPAQHAAVVAALRERPRVAAQGDRGAMLRSFRQTMSESVLGFTLVMSLLAGSIAVGVVYNAARLLLSERSRELASLRVLGYTKAEVRTLLLGEIGSLAVLALLPGFALGYGMSALLVIGFSSDLYRIPLLIAPSGYAVAGLLILAATALSARLVRRRLDRLDLIAVLKTRE
ncbi:MAG TPA: FtsX-like permease family protein [Arenimonas sp.]|nr:FtsX-like permease family protein [Arenimonas sp.]